jgi:hypothetical protein
MRQQTSAHSHFAGELLFWAVMLRSHDGVYWVGRCLELEMLQVCGMVVSWRDVVMVVVGSVSSGYNASQGFWKAEVAWMVDAQLGRANRSLEIYSKSSSLLCGNSIIHSRYRTMGYQCGTDLTSRFVRPLVIEDSWSVGTHTSRRYQALPPTLTYINS